MKPDLELDEWRAQWQSQAEAPADLRRKVERGTRNMRWMVALEVLVTVVLGGGYTWSAAASPSTEMLVLAGATWLFLAAAWTFAIANRRGTWSPVALDHAAYLRLSILRCRRKLAAYRFGVWLYFVEMVFCLAWLYRDPARRVPLPALIFAVTTPLFLVGVARYRRKTRAELESLLEFARAEESLIA